MYVWEAGKERTKEAKGYRWCRIREHWREDKDRKALCSEQNKKWVKGSWTDSAVRLDRVKELGEITKSRISYKWPCCSVCRNGLCNASFAFLSHSYFFLHIYFWTSSYTSDYFLHLCHTRTTFMAVFGSDVSDHHRCTFRAKSCLFFLCTETCFGELKCSSRGKEHSETF